MTKRVTARPVNTYISPVDNKSKGLNERTRQVGRAFQSLGVIVKNRRDADFDEAAEDVQAKIGLKATALASDYMPTIKQEMSKPEIYDQDANSFLDSDVYRIGEDKLSELSQYPEAHKRYASSYRETMLKMFQDGKAVREHEKVVMDSDKAQLTSANLGGKEAHLMSFDASLKAGVDRDDAFTTTLAVASIKGAEYAKGMTMDKRWTPEERVRLTGLANKLSAKEEAANSAQSEELKLSALTALNEAKNVQGRKERSDALRKANDAYSSVYSTAQKAQIAATLNQLDTEVIVEEEIRGQLGRLSTQRLSEGVGTPNSYRLPLSDIKRIQNEETTKALESGDAPRLIALASMPEDTPSVLSESFNNVFGAIDSYDPNNPNTANTPEKLNKALATANFITDNLGAGRMRSIMGNQSYADYQDLRTLTAYYGSESAVEQYKMSKQLSANGTMPTPEDWTTSQRSVTDYALDELGSQYMRAGDGNYGAMNRASLESQLAPMFRIWKTSNLSKGEMKKRVEHLVESSQWGGYINGRTLGQAVTKLTAGNMGNPYGTKDAAELLDDYRTAITEDVKQTMPDLEGIDLIIGNDPNTIFLYDKSGMFVPNGIRSVSEVVDYIGQNISTLKQQEKDEYADEQHQSAVKEQQRDKERERKRTQSENFGFSADLNVL
tara:strand:+ start:26614 stop:28611 length:1998 start_codon:yes stop_codon:yes gene_type:complete